MIKTWYPTTLTMEESDNLSHAKIFYTLKKALNHRKKVKGVLYTQVDTDSSDPGKTVIYIKGNRLVNRTGMYMVVKL